MFERPHHRRIARVLQALDGEQLAAAGCAFGGGTAIGLRRGEFRESVAIDFLVADLSGYRTIRTLVTGSLGVAALARETIPPWQPLGDVRADQYGVRTRLVVDDVPIKFEIVREARISFEPFRLRDRLCGVPALGDVDLAAEKLLANADRWADASVFSRDVIDLAMLDLPPRCLRPALEKARGAYGDSIDTAAFAALAALRNDPERLARAIAAIAMHRPQAWIVQKLRGPERRLRAAKNLL